MMEKVGGTDYSMSVLKIKDENGNWISIPALNSDVNRDSVAMAIPTLMEWMGDADSPFATLDGSPIPIGLMATGSYVGTGDVVELTFDFEPKLVLIKNVGSSDAANVAILFRNDTHSFVITYETMMGSFPMDWSDSGVSFGRAGISSRFDYYMGMEGVTYNYIAFGVG